MPEELLQHNAAWAAERVEEDPDYFRRLARLQAPEYLWIGCSDSRVPANVITGLQPGEVFVHRNVANLVHRGDINLLSVVQFAVESLGVRNIIVCGHYGCGGVRAAVEQRSGGNSLIDHWLQPIRDIVDDHISDLEKVSGRDAQLDRICEYSIQAQVRNLARTPILQAAWNRGQDVSIHGWVYGLNDGRLRDLSCSVSGIKDSLV